MEIFGSVLALVGGGGGAAAAAAGPGMWGASLATAVPLAGAFPAAPALAGSAFSGGMLSTILQGSASVLGLVSSISAANAEATASELAAMDADGEQALENLKGIERRRSLKLAAADAIGEMDAAYAASGVDLSFGTAAQARKEALREADLGLTSESTTTMGRLSRLQERAGNYRRMAKAQRRAGLIGGLTGALTSASSILGRY